MHLYTKLHGVISPKTSVCTVTTMRTSDLINEIPVCYSIHLSYYEITI